MMELKKSLEENKKTVVLGINGIGKSSALKRLIKDETIEVKALYIEGGRVINLPNGKVTGEFRAQTYNQIEDDIKNHSTISIAGRLSKKLGLMYKDYTREILEWKEEHDRDNTVKKPDTKLDTLFQTFENIFPNLKLHKDINNENILVSNNNAENSTERYPLNSMSDGEKQTLALICDILNNPFTPQYIIVDEPETNLHPKLANRLWATLESILPTSNFLYATHNIFFASNNSDKVGIFKKQNEIIWIDSRDFSQIEDIDDFIGTMGGILPNSKVVLCEGSKTTEIDESFYRWVLGDVSIGVVSADNCNNVLRNVKSLSQFNKLIGGQIKVIGVVDGDYKEMEQSNIIRLEFNEVESYLSHPEVIALINSKKIEDVQKKVALELKNLLVSKGTQYLANRISAKSIKKMAISLSREETEAIKNTTHFIALYKGKRDAQLEYITNFYSDDWIETFLSEFADIESKIDENSSIDIIEKALKLVPGKDIFNLIKSNYSVSNSLAAMNLLKEIEPNKVKIISTLKSQLEEKLK